MTNTQVQEFILKSKVIVSEVSSVLWWAKFIPDKIIISLDLFKVPLGDHFKDEEGIYYFNDSEALRKTDLRPFSPPERHTLPDLGAFLGSLG
jgi:hypothetical protein